MEIALIPNTRNIRSFEQEHQELVGIGLMVYKVKPFERNAEMKFIKLLYQL